MSVLLEDLYARARAKQVVLKPFFYSTQFINNAVSQGISVTQNIAIQADSHFVCRYFNVTTYDSASGRTILATTAPMLSISFSIREPGKRFRTTRRLCRISQAGPVG